MIGYGGLRFANPPYGETINPVFVGWVSEA